MASNSLRSAVVLVLLFGTLALAVPFVSGTIDAWLFADPDDAVQSKWKTQRPAAREPKELQPAAARRLPTARHSSYESDVDESQQPAPFAFDFQEEPTQPQAALAEHVDSPRAPNDVTRLQHELQELGAEYLTVERDEDRFECRALFPLSPESSYQRAFSAIGSSAETAMEQVLAEVVAWKQAARRR